jgi:iron(III) transport system ATP-binding protein
VTAAHPSPGTTLVAQDVAIRGVVAGYGGAPVLRGIDLVVPAGRSLVLLGPSGCGKTTLLRCIAGLEPVLEGTISVGGRELTRPGRVEPPERRGIGMVFQDGALFPHMTVAQNVGYGLPRADRKGARVDELLEMVGLSGYGDRRPATLSGGQQQRVALARALAPRPSVLLLDEPFSSLDTALRVQIRHEVHRLLVEIGITTILVTHDQSEAFVLGDEVAVMHDGAVVQVGPPAELYSAPASPWLAGFVGEANLLPGDAAGSAAGTALGAVPLRVPAQGPVTVLCRPEHLQLEPAGTADDAPTGGRVEVVEYYGHDTRYDVRLEGGALLAVRRAGAPAHRRDDRVVVRFTGPPAPAWPSAGDSAADSGG